MKGIIGEYTWRFPGIVARFKYALCRCDYLGAQMYAAGCEPTGGYFARNLHELYGASAAGIIS